jgi:hypothetical protein
MKSFNPLATYFVALTAIVGCASTQVTEQRQYVKGVVQRPGQIWLYDFAATPSAVKRFVSGFGAGTSELDTVVEGYAMTSQGLRRLGSGTLSSSGNKNPGAIVPAVVTIATGNPVGLIVVGGMKIYGEASGRNQLEGRAKATADAIAGQLKIRFQDRGWIS